MKIRKANNIGLALLLGTMVILMFCDSYGIKLGLQAAILFLLSLWLFFYALNRDD